MPGKAPRQKGDRLERLAADILRSYGLDAKRVPLSGSMNGFKGDLELKIGETELTGECKSRANGLSKVYQWLDSNDLLVVKQDRCDPLIVMDLRRFARLIGEVSRGGQADQTALIGQQTSDRAYFLNNQANIDLPYIDPSQIPLVPKDR